MKSSSVEAVVLKRSSVGETDRVVTLLTRSSGKLVCIAKGARSITSSKRAYLEPGNHIKVQLITAKGMPILTQATLIDDCHEIHAQLPKIRQLLQVLEMIEALFVEEQGDEFLFDEILKIRAEIVQAGPTSGRVVERLEHLIEELGYQPFSETKYNTLAEYVSVLANKPMKSWEYLTTTKK